MRISECGNYKIIFENENYILAHLMCLVPKGEFTKEVHTLYKDSKMSFGYFWMSSGLTLNDFNRKVDICKTELIKHNENIKLLGDKSNWGFSTIDFEETTKPMYLKYIEFIETINIIF